MGRNWIKRIGGEISERRRMRMVRVEGKQRRGNQREEEMEDGARGGEKEEGKSARGGEISKRRR